MPAYNFKKQFAPDVEAGAKNQTIRPQRKRPTRVGEILRLYTGMRTSECRLLRESVCLAVLPIEIHSLSVRVDGQKLTDEELHQLARDDGFTGLRQFFDFFVDTYGLSEAKPLRSMELICWK